MTLPCFSKRGIFMSEFKLISQIQYVRREMMEISLRAGFTLSRTPATSYSLASPSSNDTNCNIEQTKNNLTLSAMVSAYVTGHK